ncbi:MAG: chemotaxis protein CheW [Xenococcus sp. MO_188.B8]|nr:chemotaxis protein CheW [Xenococcus sp. MO_188.B8]
MQEYFCIGLAKSVYLGLSLEHIDKLIQLQSKDICLIPGIANFWLGVVNYKSSLLWVLDTENFLGISDNKNQVKSQQTVLILHYSNGNYQKKVALVIKSLEGVIQVEQHQSESLFANNSPVLKNICDGLVRQEEKDIALVKTDLLLEQLSQQSLLPV